MSSCCHLLHHYFMAQRNTTEFSHSRNYEGTNISCVEKKSLPEIRILSFSNDSRLKSSGYILVQQFLPLQILKKEFILIFSEKTIALLLSNSQHKRQEFFLDSKVPFICLPDGKPLIHTNLLYFIVSTF